MTATEIINELENALCSLGRVQAFAHENSIDNDYSYKAIGWGYLKDKLWKYELELAKLIFLMKLGVSPQIQQPNDKIRDYTATKE